MLPAVHHRAARRHRQHPQRQDRPAARTWSGTTATTRTWWWRRTRAPPRSPTSPTRSRSRKDFWLGDAFASGGSAGYDHKKMGITARGAWESVKRHFRDLGVDTQTEDFTVVGVGDMSGDVFGNGMLLVRAHPAGGRVRPPAHLPRPGPGRGRPRSPSGGGCSTCPARPGPTTTPTLISAGGGVYPAYRQVDPGLAAGPGGARPGRRPTAVSPAELMRAILRGAGRPALQRRHRHLREGGRPSRTPTSATRPTTRSGSTAADLRVKVVGEGGNLGLTQRGPDRVRPRRRPDLHRLHRQHRRGGLLRPRGQHQDPARRRGHRRRADRARPRRAAGRDDRRGRRAGAAGQLRAGARRSATPGRRRTRCCRCTAGCSPSWSSPGSSTGSWRRCRPTRSWPPAHEAGEGLTAPEFAVLLAYVKISLERRDPRRRAGRRGLDRPTCWPATSRRRCASGSPPGWPATGCAARSSPRSLVNEVVNRGGTSFVFRAMEESGASAADVIRAYVVVRDVYGLPELWAAAEALDNQVADRARRPLVYLETRRLLDRAVRWLVSNRRSPIDVAGEIAQLRPGVRAPAAAAAGRCSSAASARSMDAHVADAGRPGRARRPGRAGDPGRSTASACSTSWRRRAATGRDVDRGGRGLLRALRAVPGRPAAVAHLPAAPRRPLADAGPDGAALRPVRGAGRAHRRGAAVDAGRRCRRGPGLRVGAGRTRRRSPGRRNAMGDVDDSPADLAALSVLLRQIRTLVKTSAASCTQRPPGTPRSGP